MKNIVLLLFLRLSLQSGSTPSCSSCDTPFLPAIEPEEITPSKSQSPILTNATPNNVGNFYYEIGKSVFDEGGFDVAHSFFMESAYLNHKDALFILSKYHERGLGSIHQNQVSAFEYLKKAAQLGHVEACLLVSNYYRHGIIVEQDFSKAFDYLVVPIRAANPSAYYAYGTLLFTLGRKRNSDAKDSAYWIKLAANAGHADANYDVGKIMHSFKKYSDAFDFLTVASQSGHFEANMLLGEMYEHGQGVQRNLLAAVIFYQKAYGHGYLGKNRAKSAVTQVLEILKADSLLGNAYACYSLAHCYLNGIGVIVSIDLTIELYKKSLAAGMAESAYRLLEIYLSIKGDNETAYYYANIGANLGVKLCLDYLGNLRS